MNQSTTIDVIDYKPEHQPWFEKLNRAWIEKFFWMEPIDFDVLQNPDTHIINKGGAILMATHNDAIAATCALKFVSPGVYEFTKMAVDEQLQGVGIGKVLALAAIEKAKEMGAHTIILFSSRKLKPAIALYRKLGFREVPVDGVYKRSDIKMRLSLTDNADNFVLDIRRATLNDALLLTTLGASTFEETFREQNTAEDMKLYLENNFTVQKLEQEIQEEGNIFLLAFDDQNAAGFVKLRPGVEKPEGLDDANAFELERIYVAKDYFGKKVAHALMEASLDLAKSLGYKTLWLGVWEENYRALAFYDKWGFEKFGSHPFLLGTDLQTDLLLKKKL
ncbi:MAG TPA: GNAT family N-acetyltransferase [Cyclobacteriaceae bacterium]|jgi:ribosomal protein S18 acetylase RimI-like enzyme|nr:GNAT family N-acetyltransferase [Cyclobacteriaceae bacterium]